jgi:hypothetical protein
MEIVEDLVIHKKARFSCKNLDSDSLLFVWFELACASVVMPMLAIIVLEYQA